MAILQEYGMDVIYFGKEPCCLYSFLYLDETVSIFVVDLTLIVTVLLNLDAVGEDILQ